MKFWFLVSSLPMLRLGEKPLMSAAAFREACAGELSAGLLADVDAALEGRVPVDGGECAVLWWNQEVQLRDAVVRVRAKNRGADAGRFLRPHDNFSVSIEKMVADAFTRSNPLEREMELDRTRWMLAEELAVRDPFGFPAVLSYAVRLRLAGRWAGLDEAAGGARVEELILASAGS